MMPDDNNYSGAGDESYRWTWACAELVGLSGERVTSSPFVRLDNACDRDEGVSSERPFGRDVAQDPLNTRMFEMSCRDNNFDRRAGWRSSESVYESVRPVQLSYENRSLEKAGRRGREVPLLMGQPLNKLSRPPQPRKLRNYRKRA